MTNGTTARTTNSLGSLMASSALALRVSRLWVTDMLAGELHIQGGLASFSPEPPCILLSRFAPSSADGMRLAMTPTLLLLEYVTRIEYHVTSHYIHRSTTESRASTSLSA